MGADTKALRNRIKSVNSTMHLTKAMGLVASSKIRRANEAMFKTRAYTATITDIKDTLLCCPEGAKSPYTRAFDGEKADERLRIIIIAGDRGLAGGYNATVFRRAREYPTAGFIPIGKRACDRFASETVSRETFSAADADKLARQLCADFLAGGFDRLAIISTHYVSMLTQEAVINDVLPLTVPEGKKTVNAVFEPDEVTILSSVIPEYVAAVITAAVRESFASEVAARRMAMDSAGKNAAAMIDELQLSYNRARQGAITQEITEIVAGSGA